jgi:hypothetical protein
MRTIPEAQRELRTAFLGGFAGQLVTGVIWLAASAVSIFAAPRYGMAALFFGCMFIYPLTQLSLKLLGRSGSVPKENTLNDLARQLAFTVPINFLLVGAATLYREEWFFPAAMIVVGTHYIPFMFLYGIREFVILGGFMIVAGAGLALYGPSIFSLGGWLSGFAMIAFAFLGRNKVMKEEMQVQIT